MDKKWGRVSITVEEMDYLCRFFENDNHKFIFEKAIGLLYDIVKAHELNWDLSFSKTTTDENGQRIYDSRKNPSTLLFPINRFYEEGLRINHKQFEKLNATPN